MPFVVSNQEFDKMGIKLGDVVKDTVTGFTGMVIAVTNWLNGCARIMVQPQKLTKEGKPRDAETFDEMQLEVVKAKAHAPKTENGGPRPTVQRAHRNESKGRGR